MVYKFYTLVMVTLFYLPYMYFIDESMRYTVQILIYLIITSTLLLINYKNISLSKKARNIVVVIGVYVILILISTIYGVINIGVKLSAADFSDIINYILIINFLFLGIILAKKYKNKAINILLWMLKVGVILNFSIVLIQFLSPQILNGAIIEYIIGLYAPGRVINITYWRGTGTIGQAGQLGLAMTFMFSIFYSAYNATRRKTYLFYAILSILTIGLSGTKGGLAGSLIAYIFINIVAANNRNALVLNYLKILFFGILVSVIVFQAFTSSTNAKIGGINISLLRENPLSGLEHRNVSKIAALNQSFETSFILGTGAAKRYYDLLPGVSSINGGMLNLRNPDSSFSLIILRYGLIGLILYFIFLSLLLVNMYKISRNTQDRSIYVLAVGLLGTLGAYSVQFWMDPLFNMASYTMWFFVSYGVVIEKHNRSIENELRTDK